MSIGHQEFLQIADKIGREFCRDALWDKNRCTWLGWSMESVQYQMSTCYRSLLADLYSGTSGIALFLAELSQFTQDQQQSRVAEGGLRQALSIAPKIEVRQQHGFYTGQVGIAYAAIRAGELLQKEELIARGLALLSGLQYVPFDNQMIDVLSGSAGAIPVLIGMSQRYQRPELLELALAHGQHLLKMAVTSEAGTSWHTVQMPVKQNLVGHSHGVAGIVTALLELSQVSGDQTFRDTAMQGLRYESQFFNSERGNWQDLRIMSATNSAQRESYYLGWCHGAPGIGLSRLRNAKLVTDNGLILEDLDAAINTTAMVLSQSPLSKLGNFSLCHGVAGNAELLIMAGQKLLRPELTAIAEKIGFDGYDHHMKKGLPWSCGNGNAGETPNLMLGTAGIGYFYLRLFDPDAVPPILIIAPGD
ncbi:lanthionine synthetase LanC family protein [Undibacterium sp. Di24W]|uniref:lanthionine synthetase LanC family protein n=1 Tax=Undibacterium sp. Di24W TaxID=3413033 RepID=UPI003BF3CEFC